MHLAKSRWIAVIALASAATMPLLAETPPDQASQLPRCSAKQTDKCIEGASGAMAAAPGKWHRHKVHGHKAPAATKAAAKRAAKATTTKVTTTKATTTKTH
jgi:hypothetical protein